MQSKNQVIILGKSIFEKPEQTVESNRYADRVRKMRPTSYFTIEACTSKLYSLLLLCSGRVRSKIGIDLVEISIFYKSEKTSGQTVRPKQIKTVALLYLIMAA